MASQWDPTKIRARAGKIFLLPNNYSNINPPGGGSFGGTASFATSIMTLQAVPTSGSIQVGQMVSAVGVTYGTIITGLLTGVLNAIGSTYQLSTSPGTIATAQLATTANNSPGGSNGITASFANSGVQGQMTITTVAGETGLIGIGQTIIAAGLAAGTTILSLFSGTANTIGAVYNISTLPGTIATEAIATVNTVVTVGTQMQAYLGNFYNDGNLQQSLLPAVQPWAFIDAKGFDLDLKYKQVTFDPAVGLPINAGKYLEGAVASLTIGDFSAAKFQDLLSTTANETLTLARSTTQAAKTGVLIGTTPYNTDYMCLYQWASLDQYGNPIPGQYDNLFLPRVILDPDIKVNFTKNKPVEIQVKITPMSDLWMVSPDSGQYVVAYFQETTLAHS